VTLLLARYADCLYWMARYVERAENLARILDVQESFARDSTGSHDWGAILDINADRERFVAQGREVSAAEVLHFYIADRANPTSIAFDIHAARENARTIRPLITTEMWAQLNVFYNRVLALKPEDLREERLSKVCAMIKSGCDEHAGITAGTLYRDEAYRFWRLGGAIECADQTTRLLDAKYLAFRRRREAEGSAVDLSYWTALLRSVGGFQAFRRRHPRALSPEQVALFVLGDPCFPRSVAHNLLVVETALTELRRNFNLRAAGRALEHLDGIRDDLALDRLRAIVGRGGMHDFNDWLQRNLATLDRLIGEAFFGREPAAAPQQAQAG
jgi:uncharacterized alpha-E superfamily protein